MGGLVWLSVYSWLMVDGWMDKEKKSPFCTKLTNKQTKIGENDDDEKTKNKKQTCIDKSGLFVCM